MFKVQFRTANAFAFHLKLFDLCLQLTFGVLNQSVYVMEACVAAAVVAIVQEE